MRMFQDTGECEGWTWTSVDNTDNANYCLVHVARVDTRVLATGTK